MERKKRCLLRVGLLTLAVGLIVFGLLRGESQLVVQKASRVCLECIGLG